MSDPSLALVGSEREVPLVTGGTRRYVNLDYAASTPPLRVVADAVERFLPWYASVHRGAGWKSHVSTEVFEAARALVGRFFGAPEDAVVIFTRNTTDSLNLVASVLPDDWHVTSFATEHHANMLPWRSRPHTLLPVPRSPEQALELAESALREVQGPRVLAVTGASNVTGEVWPLRELADIAHRHDAPIVVDAAQLAPHRPIDMASLGIDALAVSGHKLYAPYGTGALLMTDRLLSGDAHPYLLGGGAVDLVSTDDVEWKGVPDRHEAGSPNVIGVVAMASALDALAASGMASHADDERHLLSYAEERLATVPGLTTYRSWPDAHDRVGVITFGLAGFHHRELAVVLAAEHGIGVRDGCFCAHPLVAHLLRIADDSISSMFRRLRAGEAPSLPGAVRASLGIGSTAADVDVLVDALTRIATDGPAWTYERHGDDFEPIPDPRPLEVDGLSWLT
ncbi:MAG: aminotransferase class V-fold PLP-dependent enzyme [Chloroflexi bacterium]|nr:aminotransferase class V-fold PLP-dependent enzyme [Chloroflexota bacterium]